MKPHILYPLSLLLALCATAQTVVPTFQWRVETSRAQAQTLELYRGETIDLQPRFEVRSTPMNLPTNAVVRLLYRSSDMAADTYHQIAGELVSGDTGRVSVTWTPAADNGADVYLYSLVVENVDEQALVRAVGDIRIKGTVFGDFGTPATVTNAWTHINDLNNPHQVTAAQTGAYTTAQTDALLADKLDSVETVGGPVFENFFTLSSEIFYSNVVGSTTTNTVNDAVFENWTATTAQTDYQLIVEDLRNGAGTDITWDSSNEAVATVNSSGFVEYVSSGSATITGTLGSYTQTADLSFAATATTYTNIVAGINGYLRYAVTHPLDAALSADAGANDDELFDTRDWLTHNYVRNASAWAYAITGGSNPWTGIAVWATGKTGTGAQSIRGTLISPNVIAFAWHNRPNPGTQFKYLGTDAQVHTRTLSAIQRVGLTDAGVGRLDTALPAEVIPLKILPADWTTYLFAEGTFGLQYPAVNVNRNLQAMVADVITVGSEVASATKSRVPLREPYYATPVMGDSGSPIVFAVDNTLVLLFTWTSPFAGYHFVGLPALSAAVSAVGGTQPTEIDLSTYTQNAPPTL